MSLEETQQSVIACEKCPRLRAYCARVAAEKKRAYRDETYWGRPVPGFGDPNARLLIVGLAPAAHGGNRTGRVFTGDSSGDFLFRALHKAGFANQPTSLRVGDGLQLTDAYVAAAVRCAPPDNKPTPGELASCLPWLAAELDQLRHLRVIVALGRIAFDATLRVLRGRIESRDVAAAARSMVRLKPDPTDFSRTAARDVASGADVASGFSRTNLRLPFGHGLVHHLPRGLPTLISSYHPSRQNTNTGKLTEAMFDRVFAVARKQMD